MNTISRNHTGRPPRETTLSPSSSPQAQWLGVQGEWVVYGEDNAVVARQNVKNGWNVTRTATSSGATLDVFVPVAAVVGKVYIVEFLVEGPSSSFVERYRFIARDTCDFFQTLRFGIVGQNSNEQSPEGTEFRAYSGAGTLTVRHMTYSLINDYTLANYSIEFTVDWGDGNGPQTYPAGTYSTDLAYNTLYALSHDYNTAAFALYNVAVTWHVTTAGCTQSGTYAFKFRSWQNRWFCANLQCYQEQTDHESGFLDKAACQASGCETIPTRYVCGQYGCIGVQTTDTGIGYATMEECVAECHKCDFDDSPVVVDDSNPNAILCSITNARLDWVLHVYHALNNVPQVDPVLTRNGTTWSWSAPKVNGHHIFTAEWTKAGCPPHLAYATVDENNPPPVWPGPGYYCRDDVNDCVHIETQLAFNLQNTTHSLRGPVASCDACAFGNGNCCPPYNYYDPTLAQCVPVPVCPPVAQTPTISAKIAGAVTVNFSDWPQYATSVDLLQDGEVIHSFVFADVRSFVVTGLLDFGIYHFALRGRNVTCDGPTSPSVVVEMVSSALTLSWIEPLAGADVTLPAPLIGSVVSTIGLAPENPVQMLCNGALLANTRRFDAIRWLNTFDPRGIDFSGTVTFRLFARDALGLAAFLDVAVNVNLTLSRLVKYEQERAVLPQGQTYARAVLGATFDTREPGQWIDAFISSPGYNAVLPFNDYALMEAELLKWEKVPFNDVFTVIGTPTQGNPAPEPTEQLEAVLRFTPEKVETRYLLGATFVKRTRQLTEELAEVLTADPVKVVEVTPGADVETVMNLTERLSGDFVDAKRWRKDKIVAVNGAGAHVLEISGATGDFLLQLSYTDANKVSRQESRPCVGVEVFEDSAFFVAYADVTGSRLWRFDGLDPTIVFSGAEQIKFLRSSGTRLALVSASNKIYDCTRPTDGSEVALRLVYSHTAPIKELLMDGETHDVIALCDAEHVYSLNGGVATQIGAVVGHSFSGLGQYAGRGSVLRLTASGDGPEIYTPQSAGFLPMWTVGHGATLLPSLGRFLKTYVEAVGDPLMDGTPAVTGEVLVAYAETGQVDGAFVAFIEMARQSDTTSTRARAVESLVIMRAP